MRYWLVTLSIIFFIDTYNVTCFVMTKDLDNVTGMCIIGSQSRVVDTAAKRVVMKSVCIRVSTV